MHYILVSYTQIIDHASLIAAGRDGHSADTLGRDCNSPACLSWDMQCAPACMVQAGHRPQGRQALAGSMPIRATLQAIHMCCRAVVVAERMQTTQKKGGVASLADESLDGAVDGLAFRVRDVGWTCHRPPSSHCVPHACVVARSAFRLRGTRKACGRTCGDMSLLASLSAPSPVWCAAVQQDRCEASMCCCRNLWRKRSFPLCAMLSENAVGRIIKLRLMSVSKDLASYICNLSLHTSHLLFN